MNFSLYERMAINFMHAFQIGAVRQMKNGLYRGSLECPQWLGNFFWSRIVSDYSDPENVAVRFYLDHTPYLAVVMVSKKDQRILGVAYWNKLAENRIGVSSPRRITFSSCKPGDSSRICTVWFVEILHDFKEAEAGLQEIREQEQPEPIMLRAASVSRAEVPSERFEGNCPDCKAQLDSVPGTEFRRCHVCGWSDDPQVEQKTVKA